MSHVLVDMNLTPRWVEFRRAEGHEATHWSSIGSADAPDGEIFQWAADHGCIVFTDDLDFTAILAASGAVAPSVIRVRTQDTLPEACGRAVVAVLSNFADELGGGAVISIDPGRARVRILPIDRGEPAES
jgi:predicted nuclease of predicted toxin-antitoxin system